MRPAPLAALIAALLALALTATAAAALPRHYALEAKATTVGFETDFGPGKISGTMPVAEAKLVLDFQSLANCHVSVTLDAAAARANLPFAAQAMKGPLVLDVRRYPAITFVSTAVHATDTGALIDGNISIRGVTRPITLTAELYRQRGTKPGELDHLAIRLTGVVHRGAFGADGWAGVVSDAVRIDILANIDRMG
jgi:polyisoprenoid-binding protein YceI